MKKILYRVKLNILKRHAFLVETILFTILLMMLFSSLYIQSVSQKMSGDIFSQFNIYAVFQPQNNTDNGIDFEEYTEKNKESTDMANHLSQNPAVSYFDISFSTNYKMPLYTIKINAEGAVEILYKNGSDAANYYQMIDEGKIEPGIITPTIKGSVNRIPAEFHFEKAQLKEGRLFTEEEMNQGSKVCLIPWDAVYYDSEKTRTLHVNDILPISIWIQDEQGNLIFKEETSFSVIGTYATSDDNGIDYINKKTKPIFIPYKSYQDLSDSLYFYLWQYDPSYFETLTSSKLSFLHPAYYKVENLTDLQSLLEDVKSYEEDGYRYTSTIDGYDAAISNVVSVSLSFKYLSLICFFACLLASAMIIYFEINSRKKELGILLSMGESFPALCIQTMIENSFSLFVSFLAALCFFKPCTEKLFDYIVAFEAHEEILRKILAPSVNLKVMLLFAGYTLFILLALLIFSYFALRHVSVSDLLREDEE